ncbi:MAG: hypothetical protein WAK20_18975 [Candidatus Acidiferrum sp.]
MGAGLFLLLQRFPRLLKFQRSESSWSIFRFLLGCFGAALVVLPLSFWVGWVTGIVVPLAGMALFVASILLPPPELESETDRKARELGASTMVSGGEYQPGNAPSTQARLFISSAHIWALDKNFDPLLVIPTPEISAVYVDSLLNRWLLHIRWEGHNAEFSFDGLFAERFARLAEDSIKAVVPGQRTAPKRRAAIV